jgi:hypothetical protein
MTLKDEKIGKVFIWCKDKQVYKIGDKLVIDGKERAPSPEDVMKKITPDNIGNNESLKYYNNILKKLNFSNLVVLSGAGTSVGIGNSNNGKGGLTMFQLWNALNESGFIDLNKDDKTFGKFCNECGYDKRYENGEIVKDLEKLLDYATRKSFSSSEIKPKIEIIKKFIIKSCTLDLFKDESHLIFLRKITKKKIKDSRVKIFTTNYDTFWEQAASGDRFTIIDGFTYSYPRVFNGRFFDYDVVVRERTRIKDEDSFISKLFHLYKVHGSISWCMNDNEIIQQAIDLGDNMKDIDKQDIAGKLLIYPTNNKYESSYEPPYFEMMSRFQQTLRKDNTLLITIGFSYLDKHISNVIDETLKQNPSLNLFIVDPSVSPDKENWKKVFAYSNVDNRTVIIGETFAEFSRNYPDNDAFLQQDYMTEFANKLTQMLNGKP